MIEPFRDDEGAASIGGLTVENGTQAVMISGELEVSRDKTGLERARSLKAFADALVASLEAGDLPDHVEGASAKGLAAKTDQVANPFG